MMFQKDRYPQNWFTEIRPHILERADNKCEQCGVENHAWIVRKIEDASQYIRMSDPQFEEEMYWHGKDYMVRPATLITRWIVGMKT